ncbi:ankyrin repeat-containing protein ITN1-like [Camellia sinensis]|uniref:ankyrin repeat-containing protein ITN1-like n=1 Tax=Camellia sinensis TaxID=4442 RepID=UPI001036A3A9|nr:ankyrin repeat-containing protein ITN1-like [Camellia sinensis]
MDASGNNALHMAALLGPQHQLSLRVSAAGAALQMQRELQWFKEVEKLVLSRDKEERNTDGMTPTEVFTDTHQELVKKGERWMKDTATPCPIVAALIVTMVFTDAIAMPAGNNNQDRHLYFSKHKAFIIFNIFDALALFSSIASVLMFLSILSARYAKKDFLYALPKRLIIGRVMLFVFILSMMISSGATLYLMFGDNKVWILVLVVGFSCILVTLFAALQFPLLVHGEEISFWV